MSGDDMLTLEQAKGLGMGILMAAIDEDKRQISDLLDGMPSNRANFGLLLTMLPRMGAVLITSLAGETHAESLAMPVFSGDTPDSVFFAGRMIAVSFNDDTDMLRALVDVVLARTETENDSGFLVDVLIEQIEILGALAVALKKRAEK